MDMLDDLSETQTKFLVIKHPWQHVVRCRISVITMLRLRLSDNKGLSCLDQTFQHGKPLS